ncbi:MAG: FixG Ig-like domain-containing protein [Thermodesulfovibrionales bacterium]|nr:FixG Ig-like domain-containing protein [Thermodesulfovibrionales bacterium]
MRIDRIQPWRRIVEALQAIIILGLPFLRIKGESALRFDILSLKLHFFGVSLWMEEFFIVLIATIFLTFLIVSITLIFGRIWCGWLCPQTVLVDFTAFTEKAKKNGILYSLISYSVVFVISFIVSASLIWYFVSPYEFFSRLFAGNLGSIIWGFFIVQGIIIFLNLILLRRKFCATVCPYAKLQSVMFDSKTMIIAFDPARKEECMNCMACVKTCPVGIDIRDGLNAACVSCAECIDECTEMMGRRQKKSLINYFFGLPGEAGRIIRTNAVMIGSITLLSFIFFIYLITTRMAVDMIVLPNYNFSPRITADGASVNSYYLSIKNRGNSDEQLNIRVRGIEGSLNITPDRIAIKAGEDKKIPVYVSVRDYKDNTDVRGLEISIEDDKIKVVKTVNFIWAGEYK